jgi:uncharacterized protein with NAD-binding domain and iron-sulfur cluster
VADGRRSVAVLGGGIAGLSAAHQLCKRGYRVTVFETRGRSATDLGGKARSYRVDKAGQRHDRIDEEGPVRYGEHGFRFFPGFYSHVIETMGEIPTAGTATVVDALTPLAETAFYARPSGSSRSQGRGSTLVALLVRGGTYFFLAWLIWGGTLWYREAGGTWWLWWILVPFGWLVIRTILIALTAPGQADLTLALPSTERKGKSALQWLLLRLHPWARPVVVLGALAVLVTVDRPLRAVPLLIVVTAAVWWYPALATMNYVWGLLGEIPISVRPGILESVVAFLRVTTVVTSSSRRLYTEWEHDSWWSYIGAYRYSRYYRLAFATGLTRAFVATRAEQMSARTGATILAQLLFDASPTLPGRANPADRVLDAPTHDAWISPWVAHLQQQGVRFNEFDGKPHEQVEVTGLCLGESGRIDGFEFMDRSDGSTVPQRAPQSFDHYVLAVSGTAAQRILANSSAVIRADRAVKRRPSDPLGDPERDNQVPYLDGIFSLEFGWMTGIVYHLDEEVHLPRGHLLCLESEWALTAVEQRRIWGQEVPTWKALISVNVSDWFAPSSEALPARFETIQHVADETWRQLRTDIPSLERFEKTPSYVADTAIDDPDLPLTAQIDTSSEQTRTAVLENLPLVNDEKLLVNTAGSWASRPTARTAFANLVVAGDYVRTWTDFASMESADEAAKRAVNVILEHDGNPSRCEVRRLPVPKEFAGPTNLMRGVDWIATQARLPHPLEVLALPIGWLAGLEVWLRGGVSRLRSDVRDPT